MICRCCGKSFTPKTSRHRVLSGDATVQADVERLMAGEAVDLVFTDSPYNVDYEGYTEDHLKIKNDRMTPEQFQQVPARVVLQLSADCEARRLDVRIPLILVAA